MVVVTIDLVEVRHSVLVLTSAGGALLRRRSSAPVVVIEHLTRRTRVISMTINLVQVRHRVRVLTNARRALLGRRSPALVVIIEHLTRRTRVISMTSVMAIKMFTRLACVIVVAVDLVVQQGVLVLARAGGALHRRSSTLVVVI